MLGYGAVVELFVLTVAHQRKEVYFAELCGIK